MSWLWGHCWLFCCRLPRLWNRIQGDTRVADSREVLFALIRHFSGKKGGVHYKFCSAKHKRGNTGLPDNGKQSNRTHISHGVP